MTLGLVIGLLIVDLLFGVLIGWWLRGSLATRPVAAELVAEPMPISDGREATSQNQTCLDALAGLSEEMDGHAAALMVFRDALDADRGDEELDGVRSANQAFNNNVSAKITCLSQLSAVPQNGVKELLSHLGDYHGQVGRFCETLEQPDLDLGGSDVKSVLVGCVQDLIVAKEQLAADLDSARREIEEHKVRLERAQTEARADVLTGLPNRRAYEEKLLELDSQGLDYVVVMFDADRFKSLNDTYGHDTGDAALRMIGKVMRSARRIGDFVYRVGGEEFTLLIVNSTLDASIRIAERYRKRVEAAKLLKNGETLQLTISAGVAAQTPGEVAVEVIKRADIAMYAAKQAGGNATYFEQAGSTHAVGEEAALVGAT